MSTYKKIKVLVVDDSLMFRELLAKAIATDQRLEVIAKAVDAYDARDKILQYHPDVMICDVEMPKMSGVEFIRRLLPQYPLPVIVVSSLSEAVFDAMNAGAIDFIVKPNAQLVNAVELFIQELIAKIVVASSASIKTQTYSTRSVPHYNQSYDTRKLIVIGASTGGTEALFQVLKNLPASMPGIVIVQHIPPLFSKMFADRLNEQTQLRVKEAQSGDVIECGMAIVAPGDQHIKIKRVDNSYKIHCLKGDKVNGHCPSVDVLFQSAAKEAGRNAIGIILTGMGSDGAKGLLEMRQKGARTIGQNEKTCVVYGMPKVAYTIGAVEKQVPLNEIPSVLHSLLQLK